LFFSAALDTVLSQCVAGASIFALCKAGDDAIAALLSQAEPAALGVADADAAARVKRGAAYPTCVSVNEFFGHVSPTSECTDVLAVGDLVKVELGVHVDGYPAILGETRIVDAPPADEDVAQQLAAVSNAVYIAAHCIMRMLRPGVKNSDITYVVGYIGAHFGVRCVKKLVSYEIKRYVTDGRNQILMAPAENGDEPPEGGEFEITVSPRPRHCFFVFPNIPPPLSLVKLFVLMFA
jgi:methionine aminopeptidase